MKKRILLIALIGISNLAKGQVSDTGDNVGIGTTTPNTKLEVRIGHAINQDEEIRIGSYYQSNFIG